MLLSTKLPHSVLAIAILSPIALGASATEARGQMPPTGDAEINAFLKTQDLSVLIGRVRQWFGKDRRNQLPAFLAKLKKQAAEDLDAAKPDGALVNTAKQLHRDLSGLANDRSEALALIFNEKRYNHTVGQLQVDRLVNAVRRKWKPLKPALERYRGSLGDRLQLRMRGAFLLDLHKYFLDTQLSIERMRRRFGGRKSRQESKKTPKAQASAVYKHSFPHLAKEMSVWDRRDRARHLTDSRKVSLGKFEGDNVDLVNAYRLMLGRAPMSVHPQLVQAARAHAAEMRDKNYFSHKSPTAGRQYPQQRIAAAGYVSPKCGENIAAGKFDPRSAFDGWYRSAGHHRNMLREEYREIGVGVVALRGSKISPLVRTWWTQTFGAGHLPRMTRQR